MSEKTCREREIERERVKKIKATPSQSDTPPKGLIHSPSAPVHTTNSPLTREWHQLISWVCILLSHESRSRDSRESDMRYLNFDLPCMSYKHGKTSLLPCACSNGIDIFHICE